MGGDLYIKGKSSKMGVDDERYGKTVDTQRINKKS